MTGAGEREAGRFASVKSETMGETSSEVAVSIPNGPSGLIVYAGLYIATTKRPKYKRYGIDPSGYPAPKP